jgi:hypothetical protein
MFARLAKFAAWLKKDWIADVPPELAVCEFECRRNECLYEDWVCCQRRTSGLAKQLLLSFVRARR